MSGSRTHRNSGWSSAALSNTSYVPRQPTLADRVNKNRNAAIPGFTSIAARMDREGERVYVSVRASLLSDGQGDPTWERFPCALDEFVEAVSLFIDRFRSILIVEAGTERTRVWWHQFAGPRLTRE